MEYQFKQRDLNQRLKNAISWPLTCLDNDTKLADKLRDIKLTPDLFRGLALESDSGYLDFKSRTDNVQFLKPLQGEMYAKAETLLKYEYSIMQERTKHAIVQEYFEGEMNKIESERVDMCKEREKY